MPSWRFLNATILPAIQELGVSLYTNQDICFLCARCNWIIATSVENMWFGHGQYQIPGGINRLWAAQAAAATQVPGIPLSFLAATFGSEDDNTSSQAMSRLEFKKRSLESETLEEK